MHKIILYILLALGAISCEEILSDIKTDQSATLLTVEGVFTDSLEVQKLRLSWSGDYFADAFSVGTGAKVSLYEKHSGIFVADYFESTDTLGYYSSMLPVAGIPGTVYQLRISINGANYVAEDSLASVTPILRISIEPHPLEKQIKKKLNTIWIDGTDPQDETNFYMWNISFDGVLLNDYSNIPFADDRMISDSIKNLIIYMDSFDDEDRYISDITDTVNVHVRQMGISKQAWEFVDGMAAILNKGGMFDSPMAQVKSNVWKLDDNMKYVEMQTGFYMCAGVSDIEIDFFEKNEY